MLVVDKNKKQSISGYGVLVAEPLSGYGVLVAKPLSGYGQQRLRPTMPMTFINRPEPWYKKAKFMCPRGCIPA